jgi:hypothetical protein
MDIGKIVREVEVTRVREPLVAPDAIPEEPEPVPVEVPARQPAEPPGKGTDVTPGEPLEAVSRRR